MNKGHNMLTILMFLAAIASIFFTFYRYTVKEDYLVLAHLSCDPQSENCFVSEDEYYKKIYIQAGYAKSCDSDIESCAATLCAQNSQMCRVQACSEEMLEEWERCSITTN